MTRSESLDKLLPALVSARALVPQIEKEQKGYEDRYRYAPLNRWLDVLVRPLSDNGLLITQDARIENGAAVVETTLWHASGQWIASAPLAMPLAGSGPQSAGSAITYARRYQLVTLLNLFAAGEDDDGEAAEHPRRGRKTAAEAAPGRPQAATGDVEAARERLEQAAARGTERLLAELAGTPPAIIGAIGGPRRVAQLKARAKDTDAEVTPA